MDLLGKRTWRNPDPERPREDIRDRIGYALPVLWKTTTHLQAFAKLAWEVQESTDSTP
jgi:hypothetical protein